MNSSSTPNKVTTAPADPGPMKDSKDDQPKIKTSSMCQTALSQAVAFMKDTEKRKQEQTKIPQSSSSSEKGHATKSSVESGAPSTANKSNNETSKSQAVTWTVKTAENYELKGVVKASSTTLTTNQAKDDSHASAKESKTETNFHDANALKSTSDTAQNGDGPNTTSDTSANAKKISSESQPPVTLKEPSGNVVTVANDKTDNSQTNMTIQSTTESASTNPVLQLAGKTKSPSLVEKIGDFEELDLEEIQEHDMELELLKDIPTTTLTNGNEQGRKKVEKNEAIVTTPKKVEKSKATATTPKRRAKIKVNAKVREILATARKLKNFKVEKVAEGLPEGWIEHIHVRPSGRHSDHYWFTPKTGKKLRSKPEIQKFLDYLKLFDGDEEKAYCKTKGIGLSKQSNKNSGSTSKTKKTSTKQTKSASGQTKKQSSTTKRKRDTTPTKSPSAYKTKRAKKAPNDPSTARTSKRKAKGSKAVPQPKKGDVKSRQIAEAKQTKTSNRRESKRIKNTLLAEAKVQPLRRTKILAKKSSSSNPFQMDRKAARKTPRVAESK